MLQGLLGRVQVLLDFGLVYQQYVMSQGSLSCLMSAEIDCLRADSVQCNSTCSSYQDCDGACRYCSNGICVTSVPPAPPEQCGLYCNGDGDCQAPCPKCGPLAYCTSGTPWSSIHRPTHSVAHRCCLAVD